MPRSEQFEVLVLGSGTGGKLIAWHMAQSGRRTAVVERRWVGGSCPNFAHPTMAEGLSSLFSSVPARVVATDQLQRSSVIS